MVSRNPLAQVSRAGFGQPGYCKLCASDLVPKINEMLRNGKNAAQIQKWCKEYNLTFARQTLYTHKEHITDPKTSFVDKARANPVIKRVSNRDFLEAVRDAGAARAMQDPESVSVDQALKATQIMMQDKRGHDGLTIILVKAVTGHIDEVIDPPMLIEGEYTEVPNGNGE